MPVGWDWWAGLLGNSKYYDYSLSINGTERMYGNDSSDYLTDVIVSTAILEFSASVTVEFRPALCWIYQKKKRGTTGITAVFVYCRVI